MKKKLLIGLSILILFLVIGITFMIIGNGPVNKKDKEPIIFTINNGDSRGTIVNNLKKHGLIKNKLTAKIYINIRRDYNLQAADYSLNKSMSLKDILKKFDKGEKYDPRKTDSIMFVPGKRLPEYAEQIANFINKNNDGSKLTKEDVIKEIGDKEYVKTLIEKYWFLTDEVLDNEIYYPLEGYLAPETYNFYTTSTVKEIVETMLSTTDTKLKPYKEAIEKSGYTTHEVLSMAGIIEKEANSDSDRAMVSQVIHKRLFIGMALGMDVTAYYAAKADLKDDYMYAWNSLPSKYNTRNVNNIGLPIGPICNPSVSSVKAALNPSDTNYVYFYADMKTGKVYFSEDYAGFIDIQKKLGV